jgi:CMP-N,N'-diacetyllegionaminic acid synthase
METMKIDAIILARGGSKGIPKKNIIEFCGKPLLSWTIEQCLNSKHVRNVWVSSDDHEILDIAFLSGAKLIERPTIISEDTSSSEAGWIHALKTIQENKLDLDIVLAPQVTSPLRETKDIDNAIAKFIANNLDSLFSASSSSDLFFWEENNRGLIDSISYNYENRKRRQDSAKQIIENGSFYLFKPELIFQENNRLGGKIGYFEMEFWKMFEIDNYDDLRICKVIMKEFLNKE